MTDRKPIDDVLYLPFVFVPHGAPEPTEWHARHPDWVSFPATLRLPQPSPRRAIADVVQVRDIIPSERAGPASGSAGRPTTSRNPAHVDRFFVELSDRLTDVARQLGIPPTWLIGLSAYESGWLNEHNTRLNNPFGLTRGGKANIAFASRDEAIEYWTRHFGPQVRGASSAEDFAARLQGRLDGRREPGWHRYNSVNPEWENKLLEQIETVERRRPAWQTTR